MGKKKSILFDKYSEPTPSPVEKKKPTKRVFRDEDEDSDAILQKKQKKVPQKQIKQVNKNVESDMEIDSDKENVAANQIPSPVTSKAKKNTESRVAQPANITKTKSTATEKPIESVKPLQPKEKQAEKPKSKPIEENNSDVEEEKPKQAANTKTKERNRQLLAEVDKEIKEQKKLQAQEKEKEKESKASKSKATARVSLEADGEVDETADVKTQKSQKGKKTSPSSEEPASDQQDRNAKKKRDSSEGTSQKEYEKLKQKYDTLLTIRETEPEQMLRELKESIEVQDQASSKLIAQLKDENNRLQELLQKRVADNKRTETSKQVSQLQIEVAELKLALSQKDESATKASSMISFFEKMCSVKITPLGEDRFECECFHNDIPKRFIRFELAINTPEIQYTPLKHSKGIAMPDFLMESMCFQEQELPAFLQKTIVTMYKTTSD